MPNRRDRQRTAVRGRCRQRATIACRARVSGNCLAGAAGTCIATSLASAAAARSRTIRGALEMARRRTPPLQARPLRKHGRAARSQSHTIRNAPARTRTSAHAGLGHIQPKAFISLNHSGVPDIEPDKHRLGDPPGKSPWSHARKTLSLYPDGLRRWRSSSAAATSRRCSPTSRSRRARRRLQRPRSCAEWTGVRPRPCWRRPHRPEVEWLIAEGARLHSLEPQRAGEEPWTRMISL